MGPTFKFQLGVIARDGVTGFTGKIIGRIEYLSGSKQYCIQPQSLDKDGKIIDAVWIEEYRIEV